jgi:purine-binding chemotaxis protein CheW
MAAGGDEKEHGLDWSEARRRLERLTAATEDSTSRADEAAVLEERACALARPPPREDAEGPLRELVHFRSGEQEYALDSRFALEVLRAPELTPLPGAPPPLRGLTLLRGEVLPVVELAPLFGRPAPSTHGPVLVVGAARPEFGLRADVVEEVRPLAHASLLPPPPTLGPEAQALVSGITRAGVIVLEGPALLGDGRLFFDFADERMT